MVLEYTENYSIIVTACVKYHSLFFNMHVLYMQMKYTYVNKLPLKTRTATLLILVFAVTPVKIMT